MNTPAITYLDADEEMKHRIEIEWSEKAAQHMHLLDGFSVVALQDNTVVGLISVYWKKMPSPLTETFDGYIDILEVHQAFRRRGIATHLVGIASERAKTKGVYQIRSWSSEDKIEAIPMWKALGFGLCPSTTFPKGKEVKGYFVTKVLE